MFNFSSSCIHYISVSNFNSAFTHARVDHTIEMREKIEQLDSKLTVSGEELQKIKHYKVDF